MLLPDSKGLGNVNLQNSLCRHEMAVSLVKVCIGNASDQLEGASTTTKYVTPFAGQSKLTCKRSQGLIGHTQVCKGTSVLICG